MRKIIVGIVAFALSACAMEQGRKLPLGAYDQLIEGKSTTQDATRLLGRPFVTGFDGPNTVWQYNYVRADYAARALTMGMANQKTTLQSAALTFNRRGVLVNKKYVGTVQYGGGFVSHDATTEETEQALGPSPVAGGKN